MHCGRFLADSDCGRGAGCCRQGFPRLALIYFLLCLSIYSFKLSRLKKKKTKTSRPLPFRVSGYYCEPGPVVQAITAVTPAHSPVPPPPPMATFKVCFDASFNQGSEVYIPFQTALSCKFVLKIKRTKTGDSECE